MDYTDPPAKSSPDTLLGICEEVSYTSLSVDEICESIDKADRNIKENIRYGSLLGFIEREESDVNLSDVGIDAGHSYGNDEDFSPYFRQGIDDYPFYRDTLTELAENYREDGIFTEMDVGRVFRTQFDMGFSENIMSSKINTFLKTLEYAGLGEYKRGRGDNDTRLELTENFHVLYDEMFGDEEESETVEEDEGEETSPTQHTQVTEPQREIQHTSGAISFDISLELSGDEDPERVEEIVASVRRGMNGNVEEGNAEDGESTEETEVETSDTEEAEAEETDGEATEESERREESNEEEMEKKDDSSQDTTMEEDEDNEAEEDSEESESSSSLDAFND